MKKYLSFFILLLFLLQTPAGAGPINEKKMKESADELSYMGQLDKANELLEGAKLPTGSTGTAGKASDGWDSTSLMLSMVWGAFGTGYFIFGKKQSRAVFLICGIGLCVFPLFVTDNIVSVVLGLAMTIAPFKLDF